VKINHTFGTFIKDKRKERCVSLRKFAEQVGISPVYLSNLENDCMPAPKDDVVSSIGFTKIFGKESKKIWASRMLKECMIRLCL